MTVATSYFRWSSSGLDWDAAPYEACSPNLVALNAHLAATYGGQNLGCHADRTVRGGTTISTHAYGAALDWRYENPGLGRKQLVGEILPWLIAYSAELGISAIHDYVGGRIWHAGRGWAAAARRTDGTYLDPNMGKAYALWLHIEVHRDAFDDDRPVPVKVAAAPPDPPPPPPPPPPTGKVPLVILLLPALAEGDTGPHVQAWQSIVNVSGAGLDPDGRFGPRSAAVARFIQGANGLVATGVVDEATWAASFPH